MSSPRALRVGYVVKRYPKYSETFIVNEILQHEDAELAIDIFALRPVRETHFQDVLAAVRAPVTYVPEKAEKTSDFWALLNAARQRLPGFWRTLDELGDVQVNDLAQAIELALQARARGITHLHAHFGTVAATVTRLAARLAGLRYTLTVHAKDIYHSSVDPALMRDKLRDAAGVVTVSDYNARYLAETYGEAASAVRRIYNGLDLSRFEYAPPSADSHEILAVGRLVEKKGFDVLIDACRILRERGVKFHCRIVGDGNERADLLSRIERMGLSELVSLPGPLPHAALIGIFRQAALLAAPCVVANDGDRDGLPTVLLEAMALGTPCVSTAVTGIPELVRDGGTGLCVQPQDPEALADALERLLADRPLRERLSTHARRLIEREFDIRRNAARLRDLFETAIRQPVTAAREAS
jgi:colanic acid/amylovoran biosynthesis glycosyltransferase